VKYVYGGGGAARPLAAGHAGGYSLSKWYCCIADIAKCVVLSLDVAGCMSGFLATCCVGWDLRKGFPESLSSVTASHCHTHCLFL
jgi:hypothetical protein